MKISKQAIRETRELFRSCQVNGVLDENRVRQALQLLAANKPRGYLEILSRLYRLVKLDVEQRTARVESATQLPPDVQNTVAGQIKSKYGNSMNISFAQNPALLGGLRIQAGSDLYDGSIKTRLEKLEESFESA